MKRAFEEKEVLKEEKALKEKLLRKSA